MWNWLANFGKAFWETYQTYNSEVYNSNASNVSWRSVQPNQIVTLEVTNQTSVVTPIIRRPRKKPMGSCASGQSKSTTSKSNTSQSPRRRQTAQTIPPKQVRPTPIRIVQPTQGAMEFPMDYSRPITSPVQPQPIKPQVNKPKRKAIPKKVRLEVWQTYIGSDTGPCYACNRTIDKDNWHCSHVISDKLGGLPTLENLRPCCMHCNLQCRDKNLYAFIRDTDRMGPGAAYCDAYLRLHPEQA